MTQKLNDEILEQAAYWYVTLQDQKCSEQDRQQWQNWLAEHEDHRKAWKMVEQIHGEFSNINDLIQNKEEKDAITHSLVEQHQMSRRTLFSILGVLFLGAGIGFQQRENIYLAYLRRESDKYTALGVQQHLVSKFGFEYWLNTQTMIKQPSAFVIELLWGEIFIKAISPLAKNLQVLSNSITISSQYSQFGVRHQGETSIIAVLYGEIKLTNQNQQNILLTAGQQVSATANKFGKTLSLETYQYSWIKGILAADDMPLNQWVNELQRYHEQNIKISAEASQLKVVGLFPINDLQQALAMLSQVLPVTIGRTGWNGILIDVKS